MVPLMRLRLYLCFVLAAALAGCATTHPAHAPGAYRVGSPYQVSGKWYYPREQTDYNEVGLASWYGPGFNGHMTADGEIYDQRSLTAAHATLPLPVNVRVTNLDNNRSIVLRVNDRGPFHEGRIIDVSERAAELLGFKEAGTARVRVEYLGRASDQPYTMIASSKPQPAPKAPPPSIDSSASVVASMAPVPNPSTADSAPVQTLPVPIVSSQNAPATVETAVSSGARTADASGPADLGAAPKPAAGDLPSDADFANDIASASGTPADQPPGGITPQPSEMLYVQVGAYTDAHNAMLTYNQVLGLGKVSVAPLVVNGQTVYRVRVGPLDSDEASEITVKLKAQGHDGAKIVMQ